MRADAIAWERAAEVREAAQGWRRVGAIDAATHEAIVAHYPDPCVTPSAVWRVLTAGLVSAVIACMLGALVLATKPRGAGIAVLLGVVGALAIVVTEVLERSPELARRGAAGATAFWGCALLLVSLIVTLEEVWEIRGAPTIDTVLVAGVVLFGASCRRWGHPAFAGVAVIALLAFLGRQPHGRLLWVVVGAFLVALLVRRVDDAGWAPSHRRAAMVLVVAGIAAVYAAANVYSLDERLIEQFDLGMEWSPRTGTRPAWAFAAAAIATAVLPVIVLLWGLRSRRVVLLDTGIVLGALSLVTLRHYVHVADLWVVLTVSGTLLVAGARVAERLLRRERGGFTADALFSDERRERLFQTVPVVTALTPAPHVVAAEEKGFAGQGGAFGGGGASDSY